MIPFPLQIREAVVSIDNWFEKERMKAKEKKEIKRKREREKEAIIMALDVIVQIVGQFLSIGKTTPTDAGGRTYRPSS